MSWTLKDMRDRMRTVIGLTDNDVIADDKLNSYINSFLRYSLPFIVNPPALRRTFTMKTAENVRVYGINTDMLSVVGPVYVEGNAITFTFNDEWFWDVVVTQDPDKTGEPTTVLFAESQLFFHPIPDDRYNIDTVAIARPQVLSSDSDMIFKDTWGLPVVYGAAMEYLNDIGDSGQAAEVEPLYSHYILLAQRGELYNYLDRRAFPSW